MCPKAIKQSSILVIWSQFTGSVCSDFILGPWLEKLSVEVDLWNHFKNCLAKKAFSNE